MWDQARVQLASQLCQGEPNGITAAAERGAAPQRVMIQIVHTERNQTQAEGKQYATYGVRVEADALTDSEAGVAWERGGCGTWVVDRRFSDFHLLRASLISRYSHIGAVPFPSRRLFSSCSNATMDSRRLQLEGWLRQLATDDAILQDPELQSFLGLLPGLAGPVQAVDAEISVYKAAIRGDVHRIKQLLRAGVDVREANTNGSTALHFAARYGRVASIQELILGGGAVSTQQDGQGQTAADLATNSLIAAYIRALTRLSSLHHCGSRRLEAAVCGARAQRQRLSPNSVEFRVKVVCGEAEWTMWRDDHSFHELHQRLSAKVTEPDAPITTPLRLALASRGPPVRRIYSGAVADELGGVPLLKSNRLAWRDSEVSIANRSDVLNVWLSAIAQESTLWYSLEVLEFLGALHELGAKEASEDASEMLEMK